VRVIYPPDQTCCGQPAHNNGRKAEAKAIARAQIKLFPKQIPVVLPSGSCAGMMHKHYPEILAGEPDEEQAAEFASRVFELTEFLVHVLKVKLVDQGPPQKITWHGSCHSQREMGVVDEPKQLLEQLSNIELIPLKREKECCGFGGTFSIKAPAISAAMVTDKTEDIQQTGANRVVSGDCGCLLNISGALGAKKAAAKGAHIAQFIWERTHAQ
jgi:L-lactate dehydrogenase complex protein LldE